MIVSKGVIIVEDAYIKNKAEEVLSRTNYTNDYSVDIIRIAHDLGFTVVNAELDDSLEGFIVIDERTRELFGQDNNKIIGVNSALPLETKRFTIAHEIGHYALHYDANVNEGLYAHRDHKKGKSPYENEADFFAANLLMPENRFRQNYMDLKGAGLSNEEMIILLSKRFLVNCIAVTRRIEELELA